MQLNQVKIRRRITIQLIYRVNLYVLFIFYFCIKLQINKILVL